MTAYDAASYFLITGLRAVAFGLAVSIALNVLPGSRRTRLIVHWAIVTFWAAAVLWANLELHEKVGLRPRMTNIIVEAYLVMLLALHLRKGPWVQGQRPKCSDAAERVGRRR